MRRVIPHIFTLSGLLSGMCGFVALLQQGYEVVFYWVCVAAGFDVLDGALARGLKVTSVGGKYLDSLADMVCFGALPACWLYFFILEQDSGATVPAYLALGFAPAAALRLMNFMQCPTARDFKGLPVPAAALFLLSLSFLPDSVFRLVAEPAWWLLGIGGGVALLMLSTLPLIGMKFSHYGWYGNESRYLLLLLAVICAVWLQQGLFLGLIPSYILLSLLVFFTKKNRASS